MEPNSQTQLIADGTVNAAERLARSEGFSTRGINLILSNLAVVCDRLKPEQIAKLTRNAQDQLTAVVFMALDIVPGETKLHQRPGESDSVYALRVDIQQPLHDLQSFTATGDVDPNDKLATSKLKFATEAAGNAFASILIETAGIPSVKETLRYFQGNTQAALSQANRLDPN